jgi:hypothetical protein
MIKQRWKMENVSEDNAVNCLLESSSIRHLDKGDSYEAFNAQLDETRTD